MNIQVAKALILNTATGESFSVMYNPEEFRLEQGNTFAEVGIPGLNKPPLQYVRGKSRTLNMDLFFDTYENREDVRTYTGKIVRLLDKESRTQAPPILLFSMGAFQFQCVLVEVNQRFTMFVREGTPVRATLSVRFQEYVRIDIQLERGFFFGPPTLQQVSRAVIDTAREVSSKGFSTHTVIAGDTLSGLAATYLQDPTLWRIIAEANNIDDPFDLPFGTSLAIPPRAQSTQRTQQ
jgi:hypothetical protein